MVAHKSVVRRQAAADRYKEEVGDLSLGELRAYNAGHATGVQTGYQEGVSRERKEFDKESTRLALHSMGIGFGCGAAMVGGTIWLLWMLDAL